MFINIHHCKTNRILINSYLNKTQQTINANVKCSLRLRRVASGGGGQCYPIFVFAPPPPPPDFFLAPSHGIFLSWCFWAEKTLKFAILARKSLRILAKTFAPLILILSPRSRKAGDAPVMPAAVPLIQHQTHFILA